MQARRCRCLQGRRVTADACTASTCSVNAPLQVLPVQALASSCSCRPVHRPCPPLQVPAPRPPPHCSHHHGGSPGLDIDSLVLAQLDVLTATCPDSTFVSCTGFDRGGWTAAARSRACCHSLHPAGGWSSFRIETFDAEGHRKRHGGDTWAVTLTHGTTGSAVRARVLDEGNGTYLVAYVPHLPGAAVV